MNEEMRRRAVIESLALGAAARFQLVQLLRLAAVAFRIGGGVLKVACSPFVK